MNPIGNWIYRQRVHVTHINNTFFTNIYLVALIVFVLLAITNSIALLSDFPQSLIDICWMFNQSGHQRRRTVLIYGGKEPGAR